MKKRDVAFEHMFDVLSGRDMKNFAMMITSRDGVWTVTTTSFDLLDTNSSVGVGRSFEEAYDQLPLAPESEDE